MTDEWAAIADVYDQWSSDMTADVPFYVSEAVAWGGPVLEVGVGTGRVAVAIARSGVDVVGIDNSPSMLRKAGERVAVEPLDGQVELVEADMRDFDLGRQFPLAILPYRVLAHALTTEEQVATLRAVRKHLSPGGRLVFNVVVPRASDLEWADSLTREGHYRDEAGHDAVLWRQTDYEPGTQQLHFHFVVDELGDAGAVIRRTHADMTVRLCFPGELEHALALAGFRVTDRWGWFDRRPFGAESSEVVWAAVREDSWRRP